jgi:hypothetical protein
MKKLFITFLTIASLHQFVHAQVPKKVVVEHFTNTRCSSCASVNPGFYTNYNNQDGVIHLAIHPSSPFASCVLSQHNKNDGRTNFYGIYGSTPRFVIQGVVLSNSGTNYSSASIFTPYLNQTTPASIKIYQNKYANDSISTRIVIKTESAHNLSNLSLFVALAEDTVNYTGSNGEPVHYDVFRKSLTGTSGISLTLPTSIGDSVVYSFSSVANSVWDFTRIFTLAILQDATTKEVIQSENISAKTNNLTANLNNGVLGQINTSVYYFENRINILNNGNEKKTFTLYDISGKALLSEDIEAKNTVLDVSNLSQGLYLYSIKSVSGGFKKGKLIIN